MTEEILLIIMGMSCFIYSMYVYNYSARIFDTGRNIMKDSIISSLISSVGVVIYYLLSLPFSTLNIFVALTLVFCYVFILKAPTRQAIAGAAVFVFHISTVHILVSYFYTMIVGIAPIDAITVNSVEYTITPIALLVLFVLLLIVDKTKFLKIAIIRKVTVTPRYSTMLSLFAALIILLNIILIELLFIEQSYPEQIVFLLTNSILFSLIFYFIMIYTLNFANMVVYKRYGDLVKSEHESILQKIKSVEEKMDKDELTGLYNKRFVDNMLQLLIENKEIEFGVMFVDINGLKAVNDKFGHECGDKLILAVAKATTSAVRENDYIARVGGDEFIVILNGSTENDCDSIENRVIHNLAMHNESNEFPVSASIGCVFVDRKNKNRTVEEIIEEADKKMLKNKSKFYNKGAGV